MKIKKLVLGGVLTGCLMAGSSMGSCMELSMENAVELALKNNPDVLITQLGEDTARASLRQARGKNSFSWKASSTFSRSESDSKDWENGNSNKLSVSLPLYSGGANQNGIRSGELGVDIARLQTGRKWETTRLAVIQAYYDTLEAQKKIHQEF